VGEAEQPVVSETQWKGHITTTTTTTTTTFFAGFSLAVQKACLTVFSNGEGHRSRCYGRTAALRLIVQPYDEDD
jgi:hypothetical protein